MRSKGETYDTLNNYCVTVGLSLRIVTDNTKEEYGENWDMERKKYLLQQQRTEPHSP